MKKYEKKLNTEEKKELAQLMKTINIKEEKKKAVRKICEKSKIYV